MTSTRDLSAATRIDNNLNAIVEKGHICLISNEGELLYLTAKSVKDLQEFLENNSVQIQAFMPSYLSNDYLR